MVMEREVQGAWSKESSWKAKLVHLVTSNGYFVDFLLLLALAASSIMLVSVKFVLAK